MASRENPFGLRRELSPLGVVDGEVIDLRFTLAATAIEGLEEAPETARYFEQVDTVSTQLQDVLVDLVGNLPRRSGLRVNVDSKLAVQILAARALERQQKRRVA